MFRRQNFIAAFCVLAVFAYALVVGYALPHKEMTSLDVATPAEAMQMFKQEQELTLVDVRTPEEFANSHIPGAINVPVTFIEQEYAIGDALKFGDVMVYCKAGKRARIAGDLLAQNNRVTIVDGKYDDIFTEFIYDK